MQNQKKLIYLEYLRVISALAVVMIHVTATQWFTLEIGSFDWNLLTVFNVANRFSVCVFCMITHPDLLALFGHMRADQKDPLLAKTGLLKKHCL